MIGPRPPNLVQFGSLFFEKLGLIEAPPPKKNGPRKFVESSNSVSHCLIV